MLANRWGQRWSRWLFHGLRCSVSVWARGSNLLVENADPPPPLLSHTPPHLPSTALLQSNCQHPHLDEQGLISLRAKNGKRDAAFWGCLGGETLCAHHAGKELPTLLRETHSTPSWLLAWPRRWSAAFNSHWKKGCACRNKHRTLTRDTLHPGRCLLWLLPSERCDTTFVKKRTNCRVWQQNNTQSSESQSRVATHVRSEVSDGGVDKECVVACVCASYMHL